jgi:hypothetical protein
MYITFSPHTETPAVLEPISWLSMEIEFAPDSDFHPN